MATWEREFVEAVAALEAAYAGDLRAYDELADEDKAEWAMQPLRQWPDVYRTGSFARARAVLVRSEQHVCEVLRQQSIAIRNARARRQVLQEDSAHGPAHAHLPAANAVHAAIRQSAIDRAPVTIN